MRRVVQTAWWWLPLLVTLCISLPKINQGDWRVDTGRYAAIGYESWNRIFNGDLSGFYALTEAHGPAGDPRLPYFNKPPLPLLVHGLTLQSAGRSLWATRAPMVAVLLGVILLTTLTARALGTRGLALTAGLIAATTLPLVREARSISLDLWQLLFIQAAILLVVLAARPRDAKPPRPRLALAAGAVLGLGLLCKPLVALMAAPLLAVWLVIIGRKPLVGWLLAGVALGVLAPLAWYAAAYAHWGPAFLDEHFGRQVVDRAQGKLDNLAEGSASPLFYILELLQSYWPWMITAILAVLALFRGRFREPGPRAGVWLAVAFGLAWLALCSAFADKRPRYILPCFTVWAVASAIWIHHAAPPWVATIRRCAVRFAAVVAICIAGLLSALPLTIHGPASERWERVIEFAQRAGATPICSAGLGLSDRSRFMLRTGRWAWPLTDSGDRIADPVPGAFILYDTRAGWSPGPGEAVLVAHREYTITQLQSPTWQPVRTPRRAGLSD